MPHHYFVRPFITLVRRVLCGCLLLLLMAPAAVGDTQLPAAAYPQRHGDLTAREQAMAVKAWQYFVTNYQPATGLVNAVNNYPSTTMWDSASYLAALTAARELGIIDKEQFDQRLIKFLATLNTVPLFQNQMPNKAYNTITAQKVDYLNKPGEIGFSSIDIGRMLLWLKIIKERYPEFANDVDNVVLRWDFSHIIDDCGTLYGANLDANKQPVYVQEGRLGYEEYAASGFQLWGSPPARPPARSLTSWRTFIVFWCLMIHAIRAPPVSITMWPPNPMCCTGWRWAGTPATIAAPTSLNTAIPGCKTSPIASIRRRRIATRLPAA